jgi:rhodanese-related sulfurtransferase
MIKAMVQTAEYSVTDRGLRQQGYTGLSAEELRKLKWGLRWTPTLCMAGAIVGLATQTPWIHYMLSVLGVLAIVLPAHHPLDMLYNFGVRKLTGGPKLPPNPLPRSTACFLGGLMNLGIGLAFQAGQVGLAYAIGGSLIVLQVIVISSHFCVASWMIEGLKKMAGKRTERIEAEAARELVAGGGILLDVRSPQEFSTHHLPDAENIPVDRLPACVEEIRRRNRPVVVYCASGMRSGRARGILRKAGIENVYDLGPHTRWT